MNVIVEFPLMFRMDVLVGSVVAGVIMVVYRGISMIVSVFVFVPVLMSVGVLMFVRVLHLSVRMLVSMAVGVVVGVKMFVLVVAVHRQLLS
jgi:hypothetical protein